MNQGKAKVVIRDLERRIDSILTKWVKRRPVYDSRSIELAWELRQAEIIVYIFWIDSQEGIRLQVVTPYTCAKREWREVSGRVVDDVVDAVGTLATIAINERKLA